ncbi:ribonuclease HII [Marnyiella aurantia]|uniref:Ribonuclease HII n=2 Tax=Marnyiella aurantia TaxID=2758037 RepID=A0A7D7LUW6_9FLAO|nr:ribonuclease HII [Marnyiella aurantia]MBA5247685.1 ribonuclease HII [Marnyiella aurantia]QMS99575.1 ribonuclease HII [Marnyiella aurantia]
MDLMRNYSDTGLEAGCDEVGRGCLCGPVVAAAVILDSSFGDSLVNDSKKLNSKVRQELDSYIKEHAVAYAIAELPPAFIDEHNILNASIHAMHLALDQLSVRPELILVDGNRFNPYNYIPHQCIIKGDSKVLSIAAASIIAKNYRDQKMVELHDQFPHYGWHTNMGYATKEHRDALNKYGPTIHHRQSFRLDYTLQDDVPYEAETVIAESLQLELE